MRSIAISIAIVVASGACTDAHLYGGQGGSVEADRVTLAGQVCSRDPFTAQLPLRVVIVADQAAGPLFSSFDPAATRVVLLRQFVQSFLQSRGAQFAVVGFGGRSRKLAPIDGDFTDNPGELLGALNQLSIAEPCSGDDQCRDYLDGLRTARAAIEGDLASTPAGDRVLTQYVVLLMVAGPHSPMATQHDCCQLDDAACLDGPDDPAPACQAELEQGVVASMADAVAEAGGLGLKLHIVHLAADPLPAVNDLLENQLETLAFTGGGSYQRFGSAGALSPAALNVIDARTNLRTKTLLAANLDAHPTPTGPVVDSDGDGLSDDDELAIGSDPTVRDTDGDGVTDLVEVLADLDPLTSELPTACEKLEVGADSDLDGLTDCDEALVGTEPTLVDSDGDGMPDSLELASFTDYLQPDAEADADGDGVQNGVEVAERTDPRSIDTRAHLSFGYRYELVDDGVVSEIYPLPLSALTGIDVTSASSGTTAGVGLLRYTASTPTLAWQDARDGSFGAAVDVLGDGPLDLPSSSYTDDQGDDGRLLHVTVTVADLPSEDVTEPLRLILRERECLSYTIRNIRLMKTTAVGLDDAGTNRIRLFFGETPEGRIASPGPFRIAEIPVVFEPPNHREPNAAVIQVLDEEFVSPR